MKIGRAALASLALLAACHKGGPHTSEADCVSFDNMEAAADQDATKNLDVAFRNLDQCLREHVQRYASDAQDSASDIGRAARSACTDQMTAVPGYRAGLDEVVVDADATRRVVERRAAHCAPTISN